MFCVFDILSISDTQKICEIQNTLKYELSLSLTYSVTDKMDPSDAYASNNSQGLSKYNFISWPHAFVS